MGRSLTAVAGLLRVGLPLREAGLGLEDLRLGDETERDPVPVGLEELLGGERPPDLVAATLGRAEEEARRPPHYGGSTDGSSNAPATALVRYDLNSLRAENGIKNRNGRMARGERQLYFLCYYSRCNQRGSGQRNVAKLRSHYDSTG